MEKNLHFPIKNYYKEGSDVTVNSQVNMLDRGVDPKPMVLEFCKPLCVYWKEKLERCENKLATIIKINPTKTCMYPMRDYVTCVEACVSALTLIFTFKTLCLESDELLFILLTRMSVQAQPKIHNNLVGTERKYKELL